MSEGTKPSDVNQAFHDSEIRRVWLRFCQDLEGLLVPHKDNRMLDSFIILKNKALDMVKNEKFLRELENEYANVNSKNDKDTLQALIIELRAFSSAMEISKSVENEVKDDKSWFERWGSWFLGQSSIVVGSAKDILDSTPLLKGGFTILNEVIDMFKMKK